MNLYFPAGQAWGSIECVLELRTPGNGQELRKGREKPMVDTQLGSGGLSLSSSPAIQHPLEPLTAEELGAAVALVREKRQLSEHFRFVSGQSQPADDRGPEDRMRPKALGFAPRWSRDGLDFWMLPTTVASIRAGLSNLRG